MRRLILLAGLLCPLSRPAMPEDPDVFRLHWNAFVEPMNAYVAYRQNGIIRADKLREAMKALRKLEREEGWTEIR